ncbi:hypothetical protein BC937DRAFT_90320 [Endogone sp. FLAS-F59071]|nr:hypothetical protein BC937DRAFT_90320 [Endogone sp. FLAS-F59071]|eukprot:RUS22117.1 hypothetical protein BC937DRAFT_90320 [Endogone sp. FLAS-F59071]
MTRPDVGCDWLSRCCLATSLLTHLPFFLMAEEEPLHVVIRVPFKRPQGFVEPPPIVWTEAMEQQLWQALSQNKRASLDWNLIARQMNVPVPYLIRHAAFQYETQLRGLQQQLQIAKSSSSGRSETRHRPPRLTSSTDRAPAMDRHQLSGSSLSGHSGVMAKSSRSGAEGGDFAPLSPITPRQPYSPRDQPPHVPSTPSPRIPSASPPAQLLRNSPPTSTPPPSHPRSTTSRPSSSTSLANLASSRIRNSPPQHPPLPTYLPGPQRGSPTRSPLPPIASTPPLPGRLSRSLTPDERARSEGGLGRGDGSRYFDVVGSGGKAGREEEGGYHEFGLDDAEKSDGSVTGSERSSRSEDERDEFDDGTRRGRKNQDELTFAGGFAFEAEPAFLPAATTSGGGAFATTGGRAEVGLGKGKGVPMPEEMDRNLGSGVGHGRVRGGVGSGGGLMSASQARPPTTNSFTSTPRNLPPQSGPANSIPTRFAAAIAGRTAGQSAGRDAMEQVAHAQQQIAVQAEAQAQVGSQPVAGDSPTASAQNSVGGSYSDLDGVLRAVYMYGIEW